MNEFNLPVVDGLKLSEEHRLLFRPGEPVADENGISHRLPRFFYSIASWSDAHRVRPAAHFKLSELMMVDCRETGLLLNKFPHYVPCAVLLLARWLENFRREADAVVFVSANGGYRSPAHRWNRHKTPHAWATAADIYRVGDTYLNDERSIAKYAEIARALGPDVFVRPYSERDDHLHLDLGYITVTPR
ncbi:MAG: hypothetical protein M3Y69_03470, partial [Verrucomicrobiota bacterium]|nr:hypothetical protein [Verrucomicrobiota bacterium]